LVLGVVPKQSQVGNHRQQSCEYSPGKEDSHRVPSPSSGCRACDDGVGGAQEGIVSALIPVNQGVRLWDRTDHLHQFS